MLNQTYEQARLATNDYLAVRQMIRKSAQSSRGIEKHAHHSAKIEIATYFELLNIYANDMAVIGGRLQREITDSSDQQLSDLDILGIFYDLSNDMNMSDVCAIMSILGIAKVSIDRIRVGWLRSPETVTIP